MPKFTAPFRPSLSIAHCSAGTKILLVVLAFTLSSFSALGVAETETLSETEIDRQKALEIQSKNELQTKLLRPIVGNEDKDAGARVESVEYLDDGKTVKISVSLPENKYSELEEVVVLGRPDKQKIEWPTLFQPKKFEVVNNLQEGKSGVIIYLGKEQDFLLKLNYTEPRPDVEPDVYNRD
ncbi:hypothetical protein G8770_15975 [Aestuariicella hydrocarbonica]|uniref:Uncharacterized protein n=1 Tax=Pseudomaricurvus hydrocarbonicus TaxID=1470433 RepID=A0A9E5MMM7_9GAMM|nr:hypothetical protein [Aestuariicella hydrocarbonica]NHO67048.1 hypothetical protein [Aestuariicella hydrocarbonica]